MKTAKPTFGAFNQGQVPTIACFNRATVALGVNFNARRFQVPSATGE
jgi:hypothetical protein